MNWKAFIISIIVTVIVSIIMVVCLSGCAGEAHLGDTLAPDRMGISFSQARYREEDAAYRGFIVNFQWDLK